MTLEYSCERAQEVVSPNFCTAINAANHRHNATRQCHGYYDIMHCMPYLVLKAMIDAQGGVRHKYT